MWVCFCCVFVLGEMYGTASVCGGFCGILCCDSVVELCVRVSCDSVCV